MTDVEKWLGRIEKGVTIDVAQVGSNSQISEGSEITPSPNSSSSQSEPQGFALEKLPPLSGCDEATPEALAEDDGAKDLPWQVRRVVSLHDDTTLPTITFRYFLLVFVFIPPGAFLQQLNMFRTTSAPYSIFFVQIAANYMGDWLAKTLPAWEVRIPLTRWSFNTNPGPFSVKEHVLVVMAAASYVECPFLFSAFS
jgi:hypothetical protein